MAKGAPDHHLPLEEKMDDIATEVDTDIDDAVAVLTTSLASVKDSIDNLKTTLTNLNVKPPVVETPWAFKRVGSSKIIVHHAEVVAMETPFTLINVTGSGELLSWWLTLHGDDDDNRDRSVLQITVDGDLIYDDILRNLFFVDYELRDLSLMGICRADPTVYGVFCHIPFWYRSSLLIKTVNISDTDWMTVYCGMLYTNLPA